MVCVTVEGNQFCFSGDCSEVLTACTVIFGFFFLLSELLAAFPGEHPHSVVILVWRFCHRVHQGLRANVYTPPPVPDLTHGGAAVDIVSARGGHPTGESDSREE